MARVTNAQVLKAAIKSRIGSVIVVGWDSHKKPYVAAAGRVNPTLAEDISVQIAQLADAQRMLRKIRAKIYRDRGRLARRGG